MISEASEEPGIKTKVVRVTLEGLVAKSQAQRTKQGASVFYTPHRTGAHGCRPGREAPRRRQPLKHGEAFPATRLHYRRQGTTEERPHQREKRAKCHRVG
ncbi:hypothetical protein ACVW19_006903 [Streptomyces sp. TE5632]